MISKIMIGITIAAIIAGSSTFYLYTQEVKEHAVTTQSLSIANQTLDGYVAAVGEMAKEHSIVGKEYKAITLEFNATKRELESFRHRESVILAKPGLVSIKINKAFTKQQNKIACITGDTALCIE